MCVQGRGRGRGRERSKVAVEWISLARQSHLVQLPAKVLTQQFRSVLPVSCNLVNSLVKPIAHNLTSA